MAALNTSNPFSRHGEQHSISIDRIESSEISAGLIQRQSTSRGKRGTVNNFDRATSSIDRDHSKDSENPGILDVLATRSFLTLV